MLSSLFSFRSPYVRGLLSLFIAFHFVVLMSSWLAQRGSSLLLDSLLSKVAPYTAIGNWRADITPLSLAGSTPLGEKLSIEIHRSDTDENAWEKLAIVEDAGEGRKSDRSGSVAVVRRWLLQMNGLLFYSNEDLVGRMITAALRAELADRDISIDRLRITAAARPNQDQYEQLKYETAGRETEQALQPQVVYAASVVNLGDGQISLLPQLEARRASKSLSPRSETKRDPMP